VSGLNAFQNRILDSLVRGRPILVVIVHANSLNTLFQGCPDSTQPAAILGERNEPRHPL
jgi:hypothetical protein